MLRGRRKPPNPADIQPSRADLYEMLRAAVLETKKLRYCRKGCKVVGVNKKESKNEIIPVA